MKSISAFQAKAMHLEKATKYTQGFCMMLEQPIQEIYSLLVMIFRLAIQYI